MTWRSIFFLGLAVVLIPLATVTACGPGFAPDVFVFPLRPDHPSEFAGGKLGLLLPTFPRTDLVAAYRYLNGGNLSPEERTAYQPTCSYADQECWKQWGEQYNRNLANSPLEQWKALHAKYGGTAAGIEPERAVERRNPNGYQYRWSYLNCGAEGFRTAVLTLSQRASSWGEHSPEFADWLRGQDAVFANCAGGDPVIPAPVPEKSPTLLRADRAYQISAAYFYAGDFEKARQAFAAIHDDPASPWHAIAGYLAARCLVRQAFLSALENPGDEPTYDFDVLKRAADSLQSLLKEPGPDVHKAAIQKELDLVRIRLEPMARLRELSVALAGPKSDPAFDQHLKDLTWFLNLHVDGLAIRADADLWNVLTPEQRSDQVLTPTEKQRSQAFNDAFDDVEDLRSTGQLMDWLLTFQSPSENAKDHALEEWQKTRSTPWFVAAISKATGTDDEAADLVAAASRVRTDSPVWETVTYHRARLLLAMRKPEAVRHLFDDVLPIIKNSGRDSSINAYLELRARAASSLDQFLGLAPRKVLIQTSEEHWSVRECLTVMRNPNRQYDCAKEISSVQFGADAASFFNTQAPLSILVAAARSEQLPAQLRQSVAMMGWVRSVLLKDDASASEFFPQLPAKLQEQAGKGTGFRPLVTLARNPGLRPFLEAGIQRNYSYDFVESYRDNWWCRGWTTDPDTPTPLRSEQFAFLTPQQRKEGEAQTRRLLNQGGAKVHLGELVLEYAKANPNDLGVPEALYLVLRMNRYGCGFGAYTPADKEQEQKDVLVARAAARLLRRHYVTSPWTEKARPLVP